VEAGEQATTGGLRSKLAEITHSLSLKRVRHDQPSTEAPSVGPSTREALSDRWRLIRAGLGSPSATLDSMDAVYSAELLELTSAEAQACALADEIWVTLVNETLAERVSRYSLDLRKRTAEHESSLAQAGRHGHLHTNRAMRTLVHEASRQAEISVPDMRDAVLVAALQHIVHYLIASYGTIAAHAKALNRSDDAVHFASHADSDQQFDADLSALAKSEVNPRALHASAAH
jgi:ferritin-like metal-binding protein YciE